MRLPAYAIIAMFVLIGCRHRAKKPPPPPPVAVPPVVETTEAPLHPPRAPRLPVKEGPAPLAYMAVSDSAVQIVEVETKNVIGEGTVAAGSIVSVDEAAGVRIGNTVLMKGPLPAGRTYQIFLDAGGENVIRNQRISPGR